MDDVQRPEEKQRLWVLLLEGFDDLVLKECIFVGTSRKFLARIARVSFAGRLIFEVTKLRGSSEVRRGT